ncbi:hypothetical protein PIB30_058680 [Stylosanthes scabra]|uniref:Uncharacterized protein n=1 Tax=Stylosanthes scabra TaxID=79078 RepID=A0ABU6TKL1_9FABA|nr:hypothetical protein [Stylosanthes scabra]
MTEVVKLMYDTPWLSYGKVLIEVKDRWFDKWLSFNLDAANPSIVRKTFDYRMGQILQQMLQKVRFGNEESTGWMSPL